MSWYNPDDAVTVAPEGWYPAIIESSEMKTTQKGAPMEAVTFRVYTPKREVVIKDYFHPANLWKLKKLAIAFGHESMFNDGNFSAAVFRNKALEVEFVIEDSATYGEQNKIKAFAPDGTNTAGVAGVSTPTTQTVAAGTSTTGTPMDPDEIPF